MISSRIKVFSRFPEITREVERLAVRAVEAAAREGAAAAEQAARPGLKRRARMEVVPVAGDVDGYSAGFRSTATSDRGVPIGAMHDTGTYGSYEGKGTPRRRGRARNVPDVDPETGKRTGIQARHWRRAGRSAGRKALRRTIDAGL